MVLRSPLCLSAEQFLPSPLWDLDGDVEAQAWVAGLARGPGKDINHVLGSSFLRLLAVCVPQRALVTRRDILGLCLVLVREPAFPKEVRLDGK